MDWLYMVGTERRGPELEGSLRLKFQNGTLPPDTSVWRNGLANWLPASGMPEFQECFSTNIQSSQQTPGQQIPNRSTPNTTNFQNQSKFQGFRTYNVGGYSYLMAYFEAKFVGSGSVGAVADQFTQFVANHASSGYEFFRCDEVPYRVTPGCLAGLFGAKESYGHCTIVSFRKKID